MARTEQKKYSFFRDVYEVVRCIPRGRVSTYGAIAQFLGTGQSSRMVGWALTQSHRSENVPAHRVVNRVGLLTGKMHFDTPDTMQQRLEEEGITIKNNQVEHFATLFWDPAKYLALK